MRETLIKKLEELAKEERSNVSSGGDIAEQEFYSRPGRFIIDRRRISDIGDTDPTLPVGVRTHPSGKDFPEHTHNFLELMYVFRGTVTHVIGGERITLSQGETIILGRGTSHSIDKTSDNELCVNLILSCDLVESILGEIRRDSSLPTAGIQALLDRKSKGYMSVPTSGDSEVENLMENIASSYFVLGERNEYILHASLTLLLCYLLRHFIEDEGSSGEDVKRRLLSYVKTSYSTATLSEAADIFGLSVPYLSRWTVKNFGRSFKELLMMERFSAAVELLSSTDMPVSDIIRSVGYENSSYFHKEFKKRYLTTPYQYRKKSKDRS